jgi:hypothetical protein
MRSPMFTLQILEVTDQIENAPIDDQALAELAAVPVGHVNLFDLDLKPIEERLMTHPWIREVRLQKHFPQTLTISVIYREPQAIMQSEGGSLAYVDADGVVFGRVNMMFQPDLPVIAPSGGGHVNEALQLIRAWNASELTAAAQISTLQWDAERGFRVLATYPYEPPAVGRGRTLVDLGHVGQDLDGDAQFKRLTQVFRYLSANRVQARQIWADAGKKVVVRTAHGS